MFAKQAALEGNRAHQRKVESLQYDLDEHGRTLSDDVRKKMASLREVRHSIASKAVFSKLPWADFLAVVRLVAGGERSGAGAFGGGPGAAKLAAVCG